MTKDQDFKYSSWQLIRDIWKLLKPYKWRFFLASFLRVLSDISSLYSAIAIAGIVTYMTSYKAGASLYPVWQILGIWCALSIFRSGSLFFVKRIGFAVAQKAGIDAVSKTTKHMFALDLAWHEKENSGNKLKRIQNAGSGINKILTIWFNSIIQIIVNFIAINAIIASFDTTVLASILIFLLSYFLIASAFAKKTTMASREVNIQEEETNGLLFEGLSNMRTIKVMSIVGELYKRILNEQNKLFNSLNKRIFWYQSRYSFLGIWTLLFRIIATAFIVVGMSRGEYEIGFLILFNTYFGNMRESIDELANASIDFATSKLSVARMQRILDEPINISQEEGKRELPAEWQKIEFKNVSFSYGDKQVLNGVSFVINRGERVGMVGLSGAGKSTLFKLLLKERDEFEGEILFDDISIRDIKNSDYYKHVAVVLQDTDVFNFSLRENITITNTDESANTELLDKALRTAHIFDFSEKFSDGLDTVIGERGVRLSGGERQRLGIARAIFKNPTMLLLDEATSHLDLESEEKIKDSLHSFFETVTALVIAHRLTTIKEMDKILVLEDGSIVESGGFETLYNKKGRFYELWEKQKL